MRTYIQLNAVFNRKTWRDKNAFIKEQCIKPEENKRRRKNRDMFMKIRNINGIFQPKMGTIKDSNGRDLVDAEEIKKRWKAYT